MFDRYTLIITSVLMTFIAVLMGVHLLGAEGEAAVNMSMIAHNEHYQAALTTNPASPVAGEPFTLTLDIYEADGETRVAEYDEVHTKLLHLILISQDLTEFLHLHPDYQGDGRFVLEDIILPISAHYIVFADFTPTGDHQQVLRLTLPTQNAEDVSASLEASELEFTTAPMKFNLHVPDSLKAGESVSVGFHVTDAETGEPLDTLDEYLGAAGHLVIVDEAGEVYLHTHPAEHNTDHMEGMAATYGPDLEFETEFPATGIYKMWLQVQYQGEIYTAPFVVDVAGTAEHTPESTAPAHGGHG